MQVLRRIADNRDPNSHANRFRRKRLVLLRDLLSNVEGHAEVLDLGGTPAFWDIHAFPEETRPNVTVLNLMPLPSTTPWISTLVGDARDLSAFPDRSFDIVFSNSVIEHVGDLDDQRQMAAEVRRVGRAFMVQTPNRLFPLEPHFLVPAFQFMPIRIRVALLMRFNLGWHGRARDRATAESEIRSIRLMTKRELETCFPKARIVHERFLGLTKSFIAIEATPAGE